MLPRPQSTDPKWAAYVVQGAHEHITSREIAGKKNLLRLKAMLNRVQLEQLQPDVRGEYHVNILVPRETASEPDDLNPSPLVDLIGSFLSTHRESLGDLRVIEYQESTLLPTVAPYKDHNVVQIFGKDMTNKFPELQMKVTEAIQAAEAAEAAEVARAS